MPRLPGTCLTTSGFSPMISSMGWGYGREQGEDCTTIRIFYFMELMPIPWGPDSRAMSGRTSK